MIKFYLCRSRQFGAIAGGLLALCAVLSAGALIAAGDAREEGMSSQLLQLMQLHEDVTGPVKSQFLSKFTKAKAHHASKASLRDPLAGITALAGAKGGKKKMTDHAKAAIAARMKALRQKILGDFSSNTRFGKRADCSYPYPAASCKENAVPPPQHGADPARGAIPMAFGQAR